MKRLLFISLFLIFASSANAQTKTQIETQIKDLNGQISTLEIQIENKNKEKTELSKRYQSDYPKIKELSGEILEFQITLSSVYAMKKQLLDKKFADELPNNEIMLLKMIVIQNQKILELLEKLTQK